MYVVVGASGFLGSYILKNILEKTQDRILATYHRALPLLETNSRITWQKTDVCLPQDLVALNDKMEANAKVIYLAAYHNPDLVEENPNIAWEQNIVALTHAVVLLKKAGCFYYSSTDNVYGEGDIKSLFKETSVLRPVNLYGKHKALAEHITLAYGYNVVRFPFIIGPSLLPDRPHFFDKIIKDLQDGKTIEMFKDSYRSTLTFDQCAELLVSLIENHGARDDKTVNIGGDQALSKYDVALLMAETFGLDKKLIMPVSIKDSQMIFKARRAATAILDNGKIKKLLGLNSINIKFNATTSYPFSSKTLG